MLVLVVLDCVGHLLNDRVGIQPVQPGCFGYGMSAGAAHVQTVVIQDNHRFRVDVDKLPDRQLADRPGSFR